MEIDSYGTFQICMNGDVLTDQADTADIKQVFCEKCGDRIISRCEHCQEPVKGRPRYVSQIEQGFAYLSGPVPLPAFCHKCGKPFPWTSRKQEALRELIELSELSTAEKADFQVIIPDLMVETPRSQVAVLKTKKYLAKVGSGAVKFIGDAIKEVAVEAIKRGIFDK
jgi:hypothetical protein